MPPSDLVPMLCIACKRIFGAAVPDELVASPSRSVTACCNGCVSRLNERRIDPPVSRPKEQSNAA